jgi:peptide-N4-(N-acetyl-beta-glucosaminyl)asparagine amidase
MLGCSSLLGLSSDPSKDTFLLYKRVTEQYRNPEILKIMRSLIPENIVSQTKDDGNIVSLLKWFKDDFMRWTPKDPVCQRCRAADEAHNYNCGISNNNNNNSSSTCRSLAAAAPMQAQTIIGSSWKMRKVETFRCNNCNYEYTFPRYGEILKIAETRTGRCSEWSMLFGAILSSLGIKARIVHDFLDHCWNEAILLSDGKWIHIDSTLDYSISLNHPYYYEENWRKEYEYVLAFSADKIEDVTQRYTLKWEAIEQRRFKNKKNALDFPKVYSGFTEHILCSL